MIYELRVGGFTRHLSAEVRHPGTFAALVEKIPYLRKLGVTHIELLPVMAFDEQDIPPAVAARGLENYWGYNPYSFYAPHPRFCVEPARAPCTPPASASCSTSCSITPPRAGPTDRPSISR